MATKAKPKEAKEVVTEAEPKETKEAKPKANLPEYIPDPLAGVDPMEEYVEIRLFKDGGKYSGDVFVAVNGENCVVQRGKPVKIKRKFAEVIWNQMDEDDKTQAMISELTGKAADF